jgi:NAD(P)-dependent dehydrogenase (short-subunit alcohol dehydrogenase family)
VSGDLLDRMVAVVAGGGSGIGRGIALGLADEGAAVAVVGPSAGEAEGVAGEIVSSGGRAAAVSCTFAERAETHAALARAAADLGPPGLVVHALVDPAALVEASLVDVDEATWDARAEAPLRAALWTCQAARAHLAGRGGTIVLVTPTLAMTGAAGLVPYATAVDGQRALAKSSARLWGAQGIRVNCVAPPVEAMEDAPADDGDGATLNRTALGRGPDGRTDVAPVIAMLASGAGHFVTGATVAVDGGVWMVP